MIILTTSTDAQELKFIPRDYAADSIVLTINNQNGLYLIYPGIPHIGTEIYAKAAANSRINVVGFVVRRFREDPSNARAGYNGSS